MSRRIVVLAALVLAVLVASTHAQQTKLKTPVDPDFTAKKVEKPDKGVPVFRVDVRVQVDAVGDADLTVEIKPPPGALAALKKMLGKPVVKDGKVVGYTEPKMANVLGYLQLESSGALMEKLKGAFGTDSIKLSFHERGWGRHRDGHWFHELSMVRSRIVKKRGRVVHLQSLTRSQSGFDLTLLELTLPPGAHNIKVEEKPNRIVYEASPPKAPLGKGKPSLRLRAKPYVMSALYKLYGDTRFDHLWLARSVFHNSSAETLTDFRVRFRIVGYSEWSRWERSDVVYPGQTVVDAFFPVIDTKVRDLRDATPADVAVEHSYVRPGDKKVSDSDAQRFKILGINEGVFSDLKLNEDSSFYESFKEAPLVLASFTSATDPVMNDVLGLIQKQTGGANANGSDKAALLFLQTLYNLFRVNIAYEGAKGIPTLDGVCHQHLKYGRNVLRTRSGTCVNLAILYASVCEAAGLDVSIILIPGHAFPAVRLPRSGKVVYVETTLCGGGTAATSSPFWTATYLAERTHEQAAKAGLLIEINIIKERLRGVTPPELSDAGKTPLKAWNIVAPTGLPSETRPAMTPRGWDESNSRPAANAAILGVWDVAIKGKSWVGFFDGKGKFGIGVSLDKLSVAGRYTYGNNTLTLNIGGKKSARRVTWSSDGNAFTYADDAGPLVFRHKPVAATVEITGQKHDVEKAGRKGVEIHLRVRIENAPGLPCIVLAAFLDSKANPIKAKGKNHSSEEGNLIASEKYIPADPVSKPRDLVLFLPYDEIALPARDQGILFQVNVFSPRDGNYAVNKLVLGKLLKKLGR